MMAQRKKKRAAKEDFSEHIKTEMKVKKVDSENEIPDPHNFVSNVTLMITFS